MKKETISLLKTIKKACENYQEIDLSIGDIEMVRNDVLNSLDRTDSQQKDFVNSMCDTFKDLAENGDEILLPDALENDYTESQIKQFLLDLLEL